MGTMSLELDPCVISKPTARVALETPAPVTSTWLNSSPCQALTRGGCWEKERGPLQPSVSFSFSLSLSSSLCLSLSFSGVGCFPEPSFMLVPERTQNARPQHERGRIGERRHTLLALAVFQTASRSLDLPATGQMKETGLSRASSKAPPPLKTEHQFRRVKTFCGPIRLCNIFKDEFSVVRVCGTTHI